MSGRLALLTGLLALTLPFAAGCEPCSGVLACGDTPRVRYEGRIELAFRPELAAEGVRVDFVRTAGPEMTPATLTGVTDSLGWFRVEGSLAEEGEVSGYLLIHAAEPLPPVRVDGIRLTTSQARGELRYMGEWSIPHPYLRYVGELYYRGTNQPAGAIRVEFRRTGGVASFPDTLRAVSDSTGRFFLNQEVREHGKVVGELYVVPLPPLRPFVVPGIELQTRIADAPTEVVGRWGIGPQLPYSGLLVLEDTRLPATGVKVEFRRTGGVPTTPESYTTVTNEFGTFPLSVTPLLDGEVRGELVVHSPAGYQPLTIKDVRLQTVEVDLPPTLAGVWLIPTAEAP